MQNFVFLSLRGIVGAGLLQVWEGKAGMIELESRSKRGLRGLACLARERCQGNREQITDLTFWQQL